MALSRAAAPKDEDEMMDLSANPRHVPTHGSTNSLLRRFLSVLVGASILIQAAFLLPSNTLLWDDASHTGFLQHLEQQRQATATAATTKTKTGVEITAPVSDDFPPIPRRLIFTYKWDILERHKPRHFYKNIQKTIQGYEDYWKQQDNNSSSPTSSSPIVVSFLNDTTCETLIENVAPALLPHFQEEELGSYRSDICRLAALYRHGGYYFDIDMELVQPMVAPPTVSFLTVREANPDGYFFQSFLATTPGHPVIHRALTSTLPEFYAHRRHDASAPHVWMGPYTLHQAYYQQQQAMQNDTTTTSLLLSEVNLDDHPRRSTYPTIPRRRKNHGCCCNYVIQHADTVYFYSRMVGSGPHCE